MTKKYAIDAIDIAYRLIVGAGNTIDIFKGNKPDNFTGECIVVNALPMTSEQLQKCIVNVNVFIPNIVQKIDQYQDNSQANYPRIKELSDRISEILNEVDQDDWSFRLSYEAILSNASFDEHYLNLRFVFRNENI